jgi:hypothetical protein
MIVDANVHAYLGRLRNAIIGTLEDELIGIYVEGSIALGAYEAGASDIDVIVATRSTITSAQFDALARMHAGLADAAASIRTDVAYFPPSAIRRYDPSDAWHPGVDAGRFGRHRFKWDTVFGLYVVREHGIVLNGPDPRTLIDAIPPGELRDATRKVLAADWIPNLTNEEWLRYRHRQAFAVLTMCRALHTLDSGKLTSKPEAAAWAVANIHPEWHAQVERALAWRFDRSPDDTADTLAFMRWTMQRASVLPQ